MASSTHVRDSVQQINNTSWLIGNKYILNHIQEPFDGACLHKNSDGSCYTLSVVAVALPDAIPIPETSHVRQIHDAGDASAVFSFGGQLILKVKLRDLYGGLPEHEILAFLAKQSLSFKVPTVLFHAVEGPTIYLFEPQLPGAVLNELWWDLDAAEKDRISTRVADICSELRAFQSDSMTGTDYRWMNPLREEEEHRMDNPESLQKHCRELGMDCSNFFLCHNDLGPTNVLVDGDELAIIDWDLAGYCPLEWVRTKFAICGVLDAEKVTPDGIKRNGEYRRQVHQKLGALGFPDVTEAYKALYNIRYAAWVADRPWLQSDSQHS